MTGIATFGLLLALFSGQRQPSPPANNNGAQQQTGTTHGSVTLPADTKPRHNETATAGQQQHSAGTIAQSSFSQQRFAEHLLQCFKSLNSADKISSGLLLVTALYLGFTIMIWRQMVKSNEHAKTEYKQSQEDARQDRALAYRQLEAFERPWITVAAALTGGVEFLEGGEAVFRFGFELMNIGRSVATNIEIVYRIVFLADDLDLPMRAQSELCKRSAETKPTDSGRITLFPGQPYRGNSSMTVPTAGMDGILTFKEKPGRDFIHPVLVGCAIYRYATSERVHSSGFAYGISRFNAEEPRLPHVIEVGKQLPIDQLRFEEWFFGGRYAN